MQIKTGNICFYGYDDLHHSANGPSSFITNSSGRADQHDLCRSIFYLFLQNSDCSKNNSKIRIGIQYLPYGEQFISQKNSTFVSRYKFTAKELDNELRSNRRTPLKIIIDVRQTNYTYFGARYYDSDLSMWLSVDPLASERSWVSPYSYCQNNPMNRIDPTGALDVEDGYTVDKKGRIERVDDTGGKDFDVLYNKDKYDAGLKEYNDIGDANNGLKINNGILSNRQVCTDMRQDAKAEQLLNPMTFYQFKNSESAELFFDFVTANSSVEWNKYIQSSGNHFVSTNHLESRLYPFMLFNSGIIKTKTLDMEHNHPSGTRMPSEKDIESLKQFKQSRFYNNTTFRISTIGNEDLIYDENSKYGKY